MPIAATDLKAFSVVNRPEDDTSTGGGAIDTAIRPNADQFTGAAVAESVSDGADVRDITVYGRDAAGALVNELETLNGTTPVVTAQSFERIHKAILSATDGSRTVIVRQGVSGTTRITLLPNETESHIFFIDSASGASQIIRYQKFFWQNDHGSLQLNVAAVELTADPSSKIRMGLAATKGDTATITNRVTAPGGISFVDDSVSQSVPTGAMAFGETIGVWIEFDLAADNAALKSSFTTQLSGTTV